MSALIPRSRSVLPLRKGADGWVGITLRVPSGGRVDVRSLFRPGAPAVIAERIRRDPFLPAAMRRHPSPAVARAAFALLPNGLAVGVSWAFWREDLVVPYRLLEAQLTPFGRRLAAAARWPDYRTDARHFTFCRRPDLSGAELSATGGVPCAVAHALERAVFSQRCINRIRCEAAGITCRAYWDGRYDRPFDFTHHAICRGPAGRVVMDEG